MDNSLFRSILQTVQKHAALTPDHFISAPSNQLLFNHHLAHAPISTPLPPLGPQLSSFSLPAQLNTELQTLLTNDLNEDKVFIEQTQQRLLQQLSTLSTSPDPTAVPSLVHAAFSAFHHRSINARLEALRSEISEYGPQEGSASESEDISDSEPDCDEGDDDGEEEAEGLGDEDDNAPIRPGEDIPPLETKYLPIFEALHERGKVLTKPEKTYLVNMTGMTYRQITIWFQNRRRGELKENAQRVPFSHIGSADSCASSEASDDEEDLEQKLAVSRSDTTFDIRSWRLTSAHPIKAGTHGSFPTSPTKVTFGGSALDSDSDSGDTDLSDDSNENSMPPGLQAPSLSTSVTTIDSASTANASSRGFSSMVVEPVIGVNNDNSGTGLNSSSRVTKPLPLRRSNPTSTQTAAAQPPFNFNFGTAGLASIQPQSTPVPVSPPHLVTSNVRGLTVQMNTTPPSSAITLQTSPHNAPVVGTPAPAPTSSNGSSPQHSVSAGSPPRNISPAPSGHSTSSPRPPVKPLPRRTGCAPRPRPPPRPSPAAAMSTTPSSSARASVVLPPSSNPSLGNTTLGSLLRPNQPAPRIPPEMEERLTAMAGRMGVGRDPNLGSAIKQTTSIAPTATRPAFAAPPFGSASLPRLGMPSGPASTHASGQSSQPSQS